MTSIHSRLVKWGKIGKKRAIFLLPPSQFEASVSFLFSIFSIFHLPTLLFLILPPLNPPLLWKSHRLVNRWKKIQQGEQEDKRKNKVNVRWEKWVGKVAETSEDEKESRQKSRDLSTEKRWENAKKTAKKKKRKFEEEMRKNTRRKRNSNALSKSHRWNRGNSLAFHFY